MAKTRESKCLSCEWFWKTQPDKDKRCYLGGTDGGLIDYCTGYIKKEGGDFMADIKNLADACFYYRAKHNLSQEELAEKCGVNRVTINKVENGKEVSKITQVKIRMVVDEQRR